MTSTPQPNGIHTTSTAPTARASPVPPTTQPLPAPAAPQPYANSHPQITTTTGPLPQPSSDPTADPTTSTPRPHDARTLHLILSSLGITAYQARMPLQLLDLAYRYTSSILSDAAHLAAEGYTIASAADTGTTSGPGTSGTAAAASKRAKQSNEGDVTLPALRLATSSRLGHAFAGQVGKQTMLEVAEERNRVRLPDVGAGGKVFGVRLPEERWLMTGRGWGVLEEEEDEGGSGESSVTLGGEVGLRGGETKGDEEDEAMGDGEEDENDGFEDVFGTAGGDEEEGEKMEDD